MSQVTYIKCDGCKVVAAPEIAKAFRRVAVVDQTADVCSIECAQVWVAEQFERFPEFRIPSHSMLGCEGAYLRPYRRPGVVDA